GAGPDAARARSGCPRPRRGGCRRWPRARAAPRVRQRVLRGAARLRHLSPGALHDGALDERHLRRKRDGWSLRPLLPPAFRALLLEPGAPPRALFRAVARARRPPSRRALPRARHATVRGVDLAQLRSRRRLDPRRALPDADPAALRGRPRNRLGSRARAGSRRQDRAHRPLRRPLHALSPAPGRQARRALGPERGDVAAALQEHDRSAGDDARFPRLGVPAPHRRARDPRARARGRARRAAKRARWARLWRLVCARRRPLLRHGRFREPAPRAGACGNHISGSLRRAAAAGLGGSRIPPDVLAFATKPAFGSWNPPLDPSLLIAVLNEREPHGASVAAHTPHRPPRVPTRDHRHRWWVARRHSRVCARARGTRARPAGSLLGRRLCEGLAVAEGTYVLTLDANLSRDPDFIVKLWAAR